jgi:hypothetical protein
MTGDRALHTRARALGEVGGVDDHFGGVVWLERVAELELQ